MITIHKHTEGDTRVAQKVPTYSEFQYANYEHIEDVKALGRFLSNEINNQLKHHDWTKITEPYSSTFYRDLCNTIERRMVFESGEWSKSHYELERHHLLRRVPEDVNLIDVIEMICDCVAAGIARAGDVQDVLIPAEILMQAVDNTVKLLKKEIILQEETEVAE